MVVFDAVSDGELPPDGDKVINKKIAGVYARTPAMLARLEPVGLRNLVMGRRFE